MADMPGLSENGTSVAELVQDKDAIALPDASPSGNLSFRTKLTLGICSLVLLTGAVITWLAHRSTRETTEALARSLFREVSDHAVTHTRGFVLRAAPLVQTVAHLADHGLSLDDSDQLASQLLAVLRATKA